MVVRSSRPLVVWLLLSLGLVFSAIHGFAERVEDLPKPTDYVSDLAHVLSPETVAQLDALCAKLDHSATNTQVAIVTVNNLDGDDKADYANRLEEKWKVGRKGSDRGVLMLVSVQDRHYWIEVGYGLEGILPDGKTGDIGRLMAQRLRTQDYDDAMKVGLVQIANVVAADAHVSLTTPAQDSEQTGEPDQQPVRQVRHRSSGFGILFRIILIVVVLGFFGIRGLFGFGLGMLFGGGGRGGGGWGGGGGGGWGGGGGGGGDSGGFGGFGGGESGGGGAGGDY